MFVKFVKILIHIHLHIQIHIYLNSQTDSMQDTEVYYLILKYICWKGFSEMVVRRENE